jgi:hypothetical protein
MMSIAGAESLNAHPSTFNYGFRLCPRRPLRIPRRRPAHDPRLPLPQTPQSLTPTKYNVKKTLRVPLDADERKIENALPATHARAKAKQLAAIRRAAGETLLSMRGGPRPGAGRKPRPHVRTTLLLAPEVREKLERLADRHGSMSLAAEAAIRHAKVA